MKHGHCYKTLTLHQKQSILPPHHCKSIPPIRSMVVGPSACGTDIHQYQDMKNFIATCFKMYYLQDSVENYDGVITPTNEDDPLLQPVLHR